MNYYNQNVKKYCQKCGKERYTDQLENVTLKRYGEDGGAFWMPMFVCKERVSKECYEKKI